MDKLEMEVQRLAGELNTTRRGTRLLARTLDTLLQPLPPQARTAVYSQLQAAMHVDTVRGSSRLPDGEGRDAYAQGAADGTAELSKIFDETLKPFE
jgi:hypothetical protein